MENKSYTLGFFIDWKRAFDAVKHDILVSKLQDYGIRGVASELIKCYLAKRKQYMRVGNEVSRMKIVKNVVPQGSILGPLFFAIYISDLCNILNSLKLIVYADDTNIFFTGRLLMHHYLRKFEKWLHQNKPTLNVAESKNIVFKPINERCRDDINIMFRNQELKFIGVWFQENMSWNTHVDRLTSELSKIVGCIFKLNLFVPLWLRKNVYHTLSYSRMSYSMLVWGATASEQNLNKLKVLQKKNCSAI